MNTRVRSILEHERAAGLKHLAGTHVEASIPITQRLVNALTAHVASLRNLAGLTVTLHPDNELGIEVLKPVFGFQARVSIELRIRGPVDVANDPCLYLVLAKPSFTWSAVSRVAIAAGLAPPGVEIGRDGVAIDLRRFADAAGFGDLLALVRTIAFESTPGVLRVHIVADVPEGGTGASGHVPAGPARAGRAPLLPVATLLGELRGARVWGRIAVAEDLANEGIGAALETARKSDSTGASATGDVQHRDTSLPDLATVARWIQQAGVRFESGRVVFEPDVVIG